MRNEMSRAHAHFGASLVWRGRRAASLRSARGTQGHGARGSRIGIALVPATISQYPSRCVVLDATIRVYGVTHSSAP